MAKMKFGPASNFTIYEEKPFYAGDTFDRSVLTYCTGTDMVDEAITAYNAKGVAKLDDCSVEFSVSYKSLQDAIEELDKKLQEMAAFVGLPGVKENVLPATGWRFRRRDYKTLRGK